MADQVYCTATTTTGNPPNLRDHVGAPLRYPDRNRKRKAETTTSVPVDVEMWLQEAHVANDRDTVTCFTDIHRSQKQTHEECTSKRRRLGNLTLRWENDLSLYHKLALQHAHRASETYRFAQTTETVLHHIRELHAVCTKTQSAKRDYHLMVTNLLKENTATQQLQNTYTTIMYGATT